MARLSFHRKAAPVVCDDDDDDDDEWTKLDRPTTPPSSPTPMPSWRPRRPSASASPASLKLKADPEPSSLGYRHGHYVDSLDAKSSDSSPSATAYGDSSAHSVPLYPGVQHHSASLPSRHRTGILSAASDALGLRKKIGSMSRKKPHAHTLPHSAHVVPGVIEINAHNSTTVTSTVGHRDDEHEERERLRDAAAQSIGLDPGLLHSQPCSFLDSPQSPVPPAPIPPFPATLLALHPITEFSATLPKFTPPSSLLIYALAKQWKFRTLVLTSHASSQKTHVHLFKTAAQDEKELERLEVTEDSLIFVAEEEVGGRGSVVKFAGKDVSAKQGGPIGDGNTMWFLQIKDPAESHRWIATIKNAVLTQRAVRAGLDIPTQFDGGNAPRGDMDVMLSMHLQRTISTHPVKTSAISPPSLLIPTSPSPPPSLRSLRINTSSPSPTIAMKGIFSGTRPRSPSVEGSPTIVSGHAEDSFSAAGTNLLTILRSKSSTDSSFSPSHSLPLPLSHIPRQGSPAPSLRAANAPAIITASDLKILKECDALEASTSIPEAGSSSTTPGSNTPPAPFPLPQSPLTFSLQPPPRKGKPVVVTVPTTCPFEQQGMYKHASGNHSVAGNFGIPSENSGDVTPRETPPVSPDSSGFSGIHSGVFSPNSGFGVLPPVVEPHDKGKSDEVIPNLSGDGVGCPSPGGGTVPTDKLSQSTAITKRWSRQGVPLPKQLTPPAGPPPSIPPSPENNRRISMESGISMPVTYAADCSPSSSSSNFHSRAQMSARSGSSLSPTFWKRASGSSTYSAISTSTTDSQGLSQIRKPFGGDPLSSSVGSVGKGVSLRPMSLSVYGSSPVVHIGASKRRSMPPPRPAPNFAPPPAPTVQESTSGPAPLATPAPAPQKSFRSSVAQRALRLSLTSPKPPPSSALPPRPDEATFVQGHHRRSSSTGTLDIQPKPAPSSRSPSSLSRNSNSIQRTSPPPRILSIRQRLRILSTPPVQSSPSLVPSIQVSTLDLSDDNDDDPPTPHCASPQPFGLGEHIMALQKEDDPNFLQLSSPIMSTVPKLPPRSPFRPVSPPSGAMSGWRTPPLGPDRDFIALSPPPPRRGSKPQVITATRLEKLDVERPESAQREEGKLVALSQRGSVVSLGFVTT